jgi:hypothetical protein
VAAKTKDPRLFTGDPFAAVTINGQPFPQTVRIGQAEYRVVFTDRPGESGGESVPNDLDECNWGYINFWNHCIEINPRTAPEKWFSVLMHEIVHAVDTDRKTRLSERNVNQLAAGLCDFLLDNGWVVTGRSLPAKVKVS